MLVTSVLSVTKYFTKATQEKTVYFISQLRVQSITAVGVEDEVVSHCGGCRMVPTGFCISILGLFGKDSEVSLIGRAVPLGVPLGFQKPLPGSFSFLLLICGLGCKLLVPAPALHWPICGHALAELLMDSHPLEA